MRQPVAPYGLRRYCWKTLAVTLVLASGLAAPAASRPAAVQASTQTDPDGSLASVVSQSATLSGRLTIVYGDPPKGSKLPSKQKTHLTDDQGVTTTLEIEPQVARQAGGTHALNRKRVKVTGRYQSGSSGETVFKADAIDVEAGGSDDKDTGKDSGSGATVTAQAVTGSKSWASILCRYGDSTGITPYPPSWFQPLLLGTSSPGIDHFWQETSYNNVNLAGSTIVGWYNLPLPRSSYILSNGEPDFTRLSNDCSAAADAEINFPSYAGVNFLLNQDIDNCCAWGGSIFLNRDGVGQTYSATWMPPWGYENQDVLGHEMGHGFGLPHSSGPYSQTYDSKWDVMSGGGICSPLDATYGCVGVHTVSYHKDSLGWIPSSRKYLAPNNSDQTITLERLAQSGSSGYLMAQIPIAGSSTRFYTVEARNRVGYDNQIPGSAVVIHKVDTTLGDRNAQVVDATVGDPNDAGAQWISGETFVDSGNTIEVNVVSAAATSYQVRVKLGTVAVSGPANDNFGSAIDIGSVPSTRTATTTNATTEGGEQLGLSSSCGPRSGSYGKTVWYRFTPSSDMTLTVDTSGSDYDTVLAAYIGGSLGGSRIACNDDASGTGQSRLSFNAAVGTIYHFQVGGYNGASGNLAIAFSGTPILATGIDLEVVSNTDSPDPVKSSAYVTYAMVVRNNSDSVTATGVKINPTFSKSVTFSPTLSSSSCTKSGKSGPISCNLGNLGPGARATVNVAVKAGRGTLTTTAKVQGNESDPNSGNNSLAQSTTITK